MTWRNFLFSILFEKVSKSFKKFQKVSKSFKKFQSVKLLKDLFYWMYI